MITEMWWDGNVLLGKLLLLTSPGFHERGIVSTKGDQAANLLRLGVTLGISSRGVGSLKKVGEQKSITNYSSMNTHDTADEFKIYPMDILTLDKIRVVVSQPDRKFLTIYDQNFKIKRYFCNGNN